MASAKIVLGDFVSNTVTHLNERNFEEVIKCFDFLIKFIDEPLAQCFPKTGPRTIYGPPKLLKWSVEIFLGSKTCNSCLNMAIC